MSSQLTLDNPVFVSFAFHGTLVVVKLMGVGLCTVYYRHSKKVFINPEDTNLQGENLAVVSNDLDVERTRRNHLNDIENIVPYVLIGFFYVMTKPDPSTALMHFRTFTAARFIHTFMYQFAIRQPSRILAHTVTLGVIGSMAYRVLAKTCGVL